MKLYLLDKRTNEKIPLKVTAVDRKDLSRVLGGGFFSVNGSIYTVNDVVAEVSSDSAAVGGLLGGLLGAIGGGPGVIIGGLLGAAIGQNQSQTEQKDADAFNRSTL